MKVNFIIYAPSYNENSGGCVVLHRLVHLINEHTDHQAFLHPRVMEKVNLDSPRKILSSFIKATRAKLKKFHVNPAWNTPVLRDKNLIKNKSSVVVYSEIAFGNPLNAKNIVRWYLHHPGHIIKDIFYTKGELCFRYHSAISDFTYPESKLSETILKVMYFPTDIYEIDKEVDRDISTYMVRKGKSKPFIHDPSFVCVDGLSHIDTAKLLKRSKRFICYDDYTAYSHFAVLSGAESIVVPEDGVSKEAWFPDEVSRYGIAYGTDESELEWARETVPMLKERIESLNDESTKLVCQFVQETENYFFSNGS
ncbi:hypothetical protein BTO01_13385 [Vibrio jasicida]|uniref:hypothetical protein n=1 Tax=Vibrio jasicida TaxID=766224 RepID=UPI0005F03A5C|nr:hypothetical protein [Vibrio jasicida]PQJ65360.1 hypothetical protein BTO01_13385 [Vibrio jasicida]